MAKSKVAEGVRIVVALTVTAIMAGLVLVVGIDEIVAVDTSSWSTGAQAIWGIFDLMIILVVFLVMVGWAMGAFEGSGNSGGPR